MGWPKFGSPSTIARVPGEVCPAGRHLIPASFESRHGHFLRLASSTTSALKSPFRDHVAYNPVGRMALSFRYFGSSLSEADPPQLRA